MSNILSLEKYTMRAVPWARVRHIFLDGCDTRVSGVAWTDLLSQVMDLCSYCLVCLIMCRCCLRRSVVGDGLELGSGGTEVSGLSLGETEILLVKDVTRDIWAREPCTWRLIDVRV
jgi:hypothetical protein